MIDCFATLVREMAWEIGCSWSVSIVNLLSSSRRANVVTLGHEQLGELGSLRTRVTCHRTIFLDSIGQRQAGRRLVTMSINFQRATSTNRALITGQRPQTSHRQKIGCGLQLHPSKDAKLFKKGEAHCSLSQSCEMDPVSHRAWVRFTTHETQMQDKVTITKCTWDEKTPTGKEQKRDLDEDQSGDPAKRRHAAVFLS